MGLSDQAEKGAEECWTENETVAGLHKDHDEGHLRATVSKDKKYNLTL